MRNVSGQRTTLSGAWLRLRSLLLLGAVTLAASEMGHEWIGTGVLNSVAVAADRGILDYNTLSVQTDWPWWRGPTRNGKAQVEAVPVKFGESENVRWKTPLQGRGHSSPIVVGDRVYLTTADQGQQVHYIGAFNRADGKLVWAEELNRGGFPAENHPKNTEASPTPACDGERLFVTMYHHGKIELVAIGLDRKIQWRKDCGPFAPQFVKYGYSPSPLLYQQTVIVSAEQDGQSYLKAFDRATGELKWTRPRPTVITFSSPVVAHVGGKDQLLMSGADKVSSYNPANGEPLWQASGTAAATCGTMVWDGDIVFASGGYPKSETIAVLADGSGKVLWRNNQKCYEQSMLAHEGHLYGLTDGGVMFCWRGTDGKEMWRQRLTGPVSASPVLAAGHIYWANELGTMYVIRPNPAKFELVAENTIGNDSFASPAIVGGQIFLRVAQTDGNRRQESLYCFELKK